MRGRGRESEIGLQSMLSGLHPHYVTFLLCYFVLYFFELLCDHHTHSSPITVSTVHLYLSGHYLKLHNIKLSIIHYRTNK